MEPSVSSYLFMSLLGVNGRHTLSSEEEEMPNSVILNILLPDDCSEETGLILPDCSHTLLMRNLFICLCKFILLSVQDVGRGLKYSEKQSTCGRSLNVSTCL